LAVGSAVTAVEAAARTGAAATRRVPVTRREPRRRAAGTAAAALSAEAIFALRKSAHVQRRISLEVLPSGRSFS
jgi:hypothetical protein